MGWAARLKLWFLKLDVCHIFDLRFFFEASVLSSNQPSVAIPLKDPILRVSSVFFFQPAKSFQFLGRSSLPHGHERCPIPNVVVEELGYNNSRASQLSNLAYQRDLMGGQGSFS